MNDVAWSIRIARRNKGLVHLKLFHTHPTLIASVDCDRLLADEFHPMASRLLQ